MGAGRRVMLVVDKVGQTQTQERTQEQEQEHQLLFVRKHLPRQQQE